MKTMRKLLLLLCVIMTMMVLGGCGEKERIYVKNEIELPKMEGLLRTFHLSEEGIYYVSYVILGESVEEKVYHSDPEYQNMNEVRLQNDQMGLIEKILGLGDDRIFVVRRAYEETGIAAGEDTSKACLQIYEKDGTINKSVALESLLDHDEQYVGVSLQDQDILLITTNRICLLDVELKLKKDYVAEQRIESGEVLADGNVVCVLTKEQELMLGNVETRVLNLETGKWSEKHRIKCDQGSFINPIYVIPSDGNGYYLADRDGVYEINKDQKARMIVDAIQMELTVDELESFRYMGDGSFLGIHFDEDGLKSSLALYHPEERKKENASGKKKITYGCIFLTDNLKYYITDFNRRHDDCQIIVKDYGTTDGRTDWIERLYADFIANKIDILDLNNMDLENLAKKGALLDLSPYMEKTKGFSMEDLIPSVRACFEIDGKTYAVSGECSPATLIGRAKFFEGKQGWTIQECHDFFMGREQKRLMVRGTRPRILHDLSAAVNVCKDISLEDCMALLELCNTRQVDEEWEDEEMARGEVPLLDSFVHADALYYQFFQTMFQDPDLIFVGYPGAPGNGAFLDFNEILAISANSKVKDEAWEFVGTFITKEFQDPKNGNVDYFPTRQDCLEELLQGMIQGEYCAFLDMEDSVGGIAFKYRELREEEAKKFHDVIYGASGIYSYNGNGIYTILSEEAGPYFAGEKTLEDTAKAIKNRLDLYFKEQ